MQNKNELQDISLIDLSGFTSDKKAAELCKKLENPYNFRVEGTPVSVKFSGDGSLTEAIINLIKLQNR